MKGTVLAILAPAVTLWLTATMLLARPAAQEAEEAKLAMELQNPVATVINVPIENNWDFGGSEKWSGGPTGALVRQDGGWTFIFLAAQASH